MSDPWSQATSLILGAPRDKSPFLPDPQCAPQNLLYIPAKALKEKCFSINFFFFFYILTKNSLQFSSVAQSCLALYDPLDCSMPGFPVHRQFPELAKTHVYQVSDAIQPSHPLSVPFSFYLQSFPSSGSFPRNQFFTSGDQSIGDSASPSVLPKNILD